MSKLRDELKAKWEESQKKYAQECLDELKEKGFKDEITPEQARVIMIPNHAPENFYCDGEISFAQALKRWKGQLADSGLKPEQVSKVVKLYFR